MLKTFCFQQALFLNGNERDHIAWQHFIKLILTLQMNNVTTWFKSEYWYTLKAQIFQAGKLFSFYNTYSFDKSFYGNCEVMIFLFFWILLHPWNRRRTSNTFLYIRETTLLHVSSFTNYGNDLKPVNCAKELQEEEKPVATFIRQLNTPRNITNFYDFFEIN